MAEIRTETMTVNMGPQHPSTHGVLRLVLELDGEVIQSVMPTIGYLHTGIEKTAEQKKWQQVIPLVERMLNAVNLSFVAFGRYAGDLDGQIITFFVMPAKTRSRTPAAHRMPTNSTSSVNIVPRSL